MDHQLSQYLHKSTEDHWVAVKRLLRYIKHSINYCLCFRKVTDGLNLIGYCDSDWASSVDAKGSRRSVTGYCFHLSKSSAALSLKSRKQPTVALSSCEAEYMALASATQEALYLKQLLTEIDPQFDKTKVITLFEDNQGTIALVNNPVYHQRTKHIDIRYHFIILWASKNDFCHLERSYLLLLCGISYNVVHWSHCELKRDLL